MELFDVTDSTPESERLAKGFLAIANQQFEEQLNAAYNAVESFWYRNRDADGNPSAVAIDGVSSEPTGPEILQAMGTNAAAVMTVAYARVQMLLSIQQALGIDAVDLSKVVAPYEMTFNNDGSLAKAELKNNG